MVKRNLVKKKRGRPKGSKNKRKVLSAHIEGSVPRSVVAKAVLRLSKNDRYVLRSRIETDAIDAPIKYYFIFDIKKGDLYPEIIARFTVETEATLCVEFLNGIRKISEKEYNKKRLHIPSEQIYSVPTMQKESN